VNKSTRTFLLSIVAVLALFTARLAAQEHHEPAAEHGKAQQTEATDTHAADAAHTPQVGHDSGPVPPERVIRWPWLVLWGILILFVAAAVIGPLSRMHAPPAEEMPPTHSHDEPPGASHHHGSSGTINPEPDHGHASGHGH
jgi:hypothetical protein